MSFGGLLATALGGSLMNTAQMHRENEAKERMAVAQDERAVGLLERKMGMQEEAEVRKETRQREISLAEQRQLAEAIASVPKGMLNSPTEVIQHFVSQGKPELAKNMLDLLEGQAKIGAQEALIDDRRASADLDRARTRDVGRDRTQPTATQREFDQWSQMTPEQQAKYREFKDVGRSGGADWASPPRKAINEYDSAPPEMQARLWDIEYQKQLSANVRPLGPYAMAEQRAQAAADARQTVEVMFGQRPGAAPAPAPAAPANPNRLPMTDSSMWR